MTENIVAVDKHVWVHFGVSLLPLLLKIAEAGLKWWRRRAYEVTLTAAHL